MKTLFFLDTETTGLKAPRLIQLAFVSDQGAHVNGMYKPPVPIEIEAMEVNHITEKMVANMPAFSIDKNRVEGLLKSGIVVAHNAEFDLRVLQAENIYIHEWICTKKVAKILWPDLKAHRLQYLRYHLGLEIKAGAHEAMADVKVLRELFTACLAEWRKRPDCGDDTERAVRQMVEASK